ncbi:MAG: histidine kinase dimerization/phospho-acceptor domain-containing protein [Sphingomicrobium sp.]
MVRFDDRLETVLRQPASDRHDVAVRWRQLVDLVARAGPAADGDWTGKALAVIRGDSSLLDVPLRAAAARSIAALRLPLGLLKCFVEDGIAVSAPILAAASLDAGQWQVLLAGADAETRRFVAVLHPEVGARLAETTEPPTGQREEMRRRTSISEVVERIERRRRVQDQSAPRLLGAPAGTDALSMFRWECGPDGNIGWVEGVPRGALIGRSITTALDDRRDRSDPTTLRAFAQRAPFRDAELVFAGDGALAGRWTFSGAPAFHPPDGRFAGYRGIALRTSADEARSGAQQMVFDGDSLRELVHEIKTPLNAIIGFAQIIDGQFLGPAGQRYRERAIGIVGQAQILLEAIEDLDFVARSRSAAVDPVTTDLVRVVAVAVEALRTAGESGGSAIEMVASPKPLMGAIDGQSARRLVERLLRAVLQVADSEDHLEVRVVRKGDQATVLVRRPRGLTKTEAVLLGSTSEGNMSDHRGRLSLRLAAGLARIAGAELTVGKEELSLAFAAA